MWRIEFSSDLFLPYLPEGSPAESRSVRFPNWRIGYRHIPRRPANFLHPWPGANSSTLMP